MRTSVTILCDNSIRGPGFLGEHGFSALVGRGEADYLFDTGPGLSLPYNLEKLNKDLGRVKAVCLSHGHYDHTGGLKWVVDRMGGVDVVAHPRVFAPHMVRETDDPADKGRYIGCPFPQADLEERGARFRFVDRTTEIAPGIWFVAGVERTPDQNPKDDRLVLPSENGFVPDPIEDDASLVVETEGDPVLLLGCAHAGILNILDHVRHRMGVSRLRAVLGGTHLLFYGPEFIPRLIEKLEALSVRWIGVSHCTGLRAALALSRHFGDRFVWASAGSVFEF